VTFDKVGVVPNATPKSPKGDFQFHRKKQNGSRFRVRGKPLPLIFMQHDNSTPKPDMFLGAAHYLFENAHELRFRETEAEKILWAKLVRSSSV
jgi:hypothetical protein